MVGDLRIASQREESNTSGPLSVLGLHADYPPATRWLVGGVVPYFSAEHDGLIVEAGLYAEQFIDRSRGVSVGSNLVKSDVDFDERDWGGNLEYEYGGMPASASLRCRHGPPAAGGEILQKAAKYPVLLNVRVQQITSFLTGSR